MTKQYLQTHETFIEAIRQIAISQLSDDTEIETLKNTRLCYGGTSSSIRGQTRFEQWQNGDIKPADLVVINPCIESSWLQIAGTTLHELGHVLSGIGSGHGKDWKDNCKRLGLQNIMAAGQCYNTESFNSYVWERLLVTYKPTDGKPINYHSDSSNVSFKPCSHGVGSRGGKSRGKGSGSRMKKYICQCEKPVIIRHAGDNLHAHCDDCSAPFQQPN